MEALRVALGERSYPIHIGAGILDASDLYRPHLGSGRVAVAQFMVGQNTTDKPPMVGDPAMGLGIHVEIRLGTDNDWGSPP